MTSTAPLAPRPFESLLHQAEKEISRVTGKPRAIGWEYDPAQPPANRWIAFVIGLTHTESFHGETGESALRRCFEAYSARPPRG